MSKLVLETIEGYSGPLKKHKLVALVALVLREAYFSGFFKKENSKGEFELSSNWLQGKLGHDYRSYVDWLTYEGLINKRKSHEVGVKCRTYALSPWVLEDMDKEKVTWQEKMKTGHTSVGSLDVAGVTIPRFDELREDFSRLRIDGSSARTWLTRSGMAGYKAWHCAGSIDAIESGNTYFVTDGYGRLHSNFTTLKREVRRTHCTVDREQLREVDIPNSQPMFLLSLMLGDHGLPGDGFVEDVLGRRVYRRVKEEIGGVDDVGKAPVFKVLFGKQTGQTRYDRCFMRLYPETYDWLRHVKDVQGDHKTVAHMLQRAESDFVFGRVVDAIKTEAPRTRLLTVHDAVVCRASDVEYVESVMRTELDDLLQSLGGSRVGKQRTAVAV